MIITGKKFSKPEMSRVINGDKTIENRDIRPELFRLDHILMEKYPDFPRATLQKFTEEGRVTVDGEKITKFSKKFPKTASITVDFPEITKKSLPNVPVIYEDSHVKVIEKPAGLLSMTKGDYCPEPTVEDFGLLVHRLDRDTSGVMILAKDEPTQTFLRKQFQARTTKKTYYAVVIGHPRLDEAIIDLPIGRDLAHPTTFRVDPAGRPSVTEYRVIKKSEKYSLIELHPTTGRTHQLRVHMRHLGTPILGDRVYGPEKNPKTRLMLHAASLEITIPDTPNNRRETFKTDIPKEFLDVLR